MPKSRRLPQKLDQSPEFEPDYIQPIDYCRPLIGAFGFALVYGTVCSILSAMFTGFAFAPCVFAGICFTMPLLVLVSAFFHHQLWVYRLRKHGSEAFENHETLAMPLEEAFELALAASAQFKNSKVEKCDQKNNTIRVRVKGNFWVTVDRVVEIKVHRVTSVKSRISVNSVIRLTRFRELMFAMVWGPKWQPILFRTDFNKNKKIMDEITTFVQNIPNWDHKYLPGESYKQLNDQLATENAAA